MDATTSGTPALQYLNLPEQLVSTTSPPVSPFQRAKRHCFGDTTPGEFPLAANPSIVLHVLTECKLDPRDLANLEVPFSNNVEIFTEILRIDCSADFDFCCCFRQHARSLASQQTLLRTLIYLYRSLLLLTCVIKGRFSSR